MASHEPLPGKCGAPLSKRPGLFCEKDAGAGTGHKGFGSCDLHRGSTPSGEVYGKKLMAQAMVQAYVPEVVEPVTRPEAALARLAGEAHGWKEACARAVNELESTVNDTKFGPKTAPEVEMYERAVASCHRIFADIVKLNLTERLVRVEELEAVRMFGAIERALVKGGAWTPELRALLAAEFAAMQDEA